MKYSLRSLMIVALIGPPILAGIYFGVRYVLRNELAQFIVVVLVLLAARELVRPGMKIQD